MSCDFESSTIGGIPVSIFPSMTSCSSYPGISIFTSFVHAEKSNERIPKRRSDFIVFIGLKFKVPGKAWDDWEEGNLLHGEFKVSAQKVTIIVYVQEERIRTVVCIVNRDRTVATEFLFHLNVLSRVWVQFCFVGLVINGH